MNFKNCQTREQVGAERLEPRGGLFEGSGTDGFIPGFRTIVLIRKFYISLLNDGQQFY